MVVVESNNNINMSVIFPHDALISHAWIGASVLKINPCRLALKI